MKRLIASLSFYTPLTRIDIHRLLDQERQAMLKKAEELNEAAGWSNPMNGPHNF